MAERRLLSGVEVSRSHNRKTKKELKINKKKYRNN